MKFIPFYPPVPLPSFLNKSASARFNHLTMSVRAFSNMCWSIQAQSTDHTVANRPCQQAPANRNGLAQSSRHQRLETLAVEVSHEYGNRANI